MRAPHQGRGYVGSILPIWQKAKHQSHLLHRRDPVRFVERKHTADPDGIDIAICLDRRAYRGCLMDINVTRQNNVKKPAASTSLDEASGVNCSAFSPELSVHRTSPTYPTPRRRGSGSGVPVCRGSQSPSGRKTRSRPDNGSRNARLVTNDDAFACLCCR